MSGGSEANFALGWAVNVDSHVALLKAAHAHSDRVWKPSGLKMVYVFISSLAVYGGPKCKPTDHVIPEWVKLKPWLTIAIRPSSPDRRMASKRPLASCTRTTTDARGTSIPAPVVSRPSRSVLAQ